MSLADFCAKRMGLAPAGGAIAYAGPATAAGSLPVSVGSRRACVGSFPTAARLPGVGIVPPALNRAEPSGSLADYVLGRQTVGLSRPEAPTDRDGGSRRPVPGAQPSLQSSKRPIEAAHKLPPPGAPAISAVLPPTKPTLPANAAEEETAKRDKEAQSLLDLLPPFALKVAGGIGSKLPQSSYAAAAHKYLVNTGGKSSDAAKGLRLFIKDYCDFLVASGILATGSWDGQPSSIWPISQADALACRDHLRTSGCETAADRVPRALAYARTLALPVANFSAAVFNERRGRRQAAGKARKAPPPWLVWAVCEAACNPPPGSTEVQIEKFRELYVDMLGASRGGGFHGSSVIPPDASGTDPDRPPGVWHLVCFEDKLQRSDVHQYVPQMDITTGAPLGPWADQWTRDRTGLEFVISDWLDEGARSTSAADATHLRRDEQGNLTFAVKDRATKGLVDIVPLVAKVDMATLQAGKISGTHPYRHLAGEVSEHLDWPEAEANILGDWTTSKAGADGFKSGAPKGQAGTRKKWYAVEATRDQQVRARTRFIRAVAAGFSRLGTSADVQTMSWADVFPHPAPPELAEFYGPEAMTRPAKRGRSPAAGPAKTPALATAKTLQTPSAATGRGCRAKVASFALALTPAVAAPVPKRQRRS